MGLILLFAGTFTETFGVLGVLVVVFAAVVVVVVGLVASNLCCIDWTCEAEAALVVVVAAAFFGAEKMPTFEGVVDLLAIEAPAAAVRGVFGLTGFVKRMATLDAFLFAFGPVGPVAGMFGTLLVLAALVFVDPGSGGANVLLPNPPALALLFFALAGAAVTPPPPADFIELAAVLAADGSTLAGDMGLVPFALFANVGFVTVLLLPLLTGGAIVCGLAAAGGGGGGAAAVAAIADASPTGGLLGTAGAPLVVEVVVVVAAVSLVSLGVVLFSLTSVVAVLFEEGAGEGEANVLIIIFNGACRLAALEGV